MKWFDLIFRGYRSSKAKDKSIPQSTYKDGSYQISKHAIDRMNERKISKGDVHFNLHTKPLKRSKVKYDAQRRPSYERISSNSVATHINPKSKIVTTVHKVHTKKINKIKKGE